MKTILQKKSDGGIVHYRPTEELRELMTGSGHGWSQEQIKVEAAKFSSSDGDDTDWPGFPEEFALRWCSAIGRGGLSENQMIELLAERTRKRRGYQHTVIIDLEDLPIEFTERREHRDSLKFDDVIKKIDHVFLT